MAAVTISSDFGAPKIKLSHYFHCFPFYDMKWWDLYAEYIMRNPGLDEAQAGIKTARGNINNLRYADDTTLTAESEEELKSCWWR